MRTGASGALPRRVQGSYHRPVTHLKPTALPASTEHACARVGLGQHVPHVGIAPQPQRPDGAVARPRAQRAVSAARQELPFVRHHRADDTGRRTLQLSRRQRPKLPERADTGQPPIGGCRRGGSGRRGVARGRRGEAGPRQGARGATPSGLPVGRPQLGGRPAQGLARRGLARRGLACSGGSGATPNAAVGSGARSGAGRERPVSSAACPTGLRADRLPSVPTGEEAGARPTRSAACRADPSSLMGLCPKPVNSP